jgi:hypothetical protein
LHKGTVNGGSIPFGTYLVPEANVTDLRDHEAFSRIDQKVGERDNLFLRYLLDDLLTPLAPSFSPSEIGFSDDGLLPEWRNFLADRTQNFGSSWTHASNRALNELRLSYSRTSSTVGPLHMNSEEGDTPAITVSDSFAPSPFYLSSPGFVFTLGSDSQPTRLNSNVFQLQENYSFTHGSHDVKIGVNFNETRSGLNQISGGLGHYFYDGFQFFVDNQPTGASLRFGNLDGKGGQVLPLRGLDQFYFIEDDIHLRSNLVLNLGLRYENYSPSFNAVVDRSENTTLSPPEISRVFTNLAPRLGFAWGLGQRTVIRGGLGIFSNPTFLDIALLAWQSGPISPFVETGGFLSAESPELPNVTNVYPNRPFNGADVTAPFLGTVDCSGNLLPPGSTGATPLDCATQNTVSRDLRNPFEYSASLGIQRQISRDFLLGASYVGSRGTRLFQRLDINPTGPVIGANCSPSVESCDSFSFIQKPPRQPNRGTMTEIANTGFSTYDSLQLSATKRFRGGSFWDRVTLTSAYTWSHMIDNTSDPFGSTVLQGLVVQQLTTSGFVGPGEPLEDPTPFAQNPANTRAGERGNSSFDHRHRLASSFVWTLPDPPKVWSLLFGNWKIGGIFTAQSGQPFSPFSNCSVFNPQPLGIGNARPNIGNPHAAENTVALLNDPFCLDPNSSDPAVQAVIQQVGGGYSTPLFEQVNPAQVRFVQAPVTSGLFGNAGRNILTGPGSANLDLALSKTIPMGERLRVLLRAEVYDLMNRENPGPFAGNPLIAAAQQVSSTAFNQIPGNPSTTTQARVSGLTPENNLAAGLSYLPPDKPVLGYPFLSQRYLTTSSRRVQFSVRFSF